MRENSKKKKDMGMLEKWPFSYMHTHTYCHFPHGNIIQLAR